MDSGGIKDAVCAGKYQLNINDQPLWNWEKIADVWPWLPSEGQLHICVSLPANMGSPTLVDTTGASYVLFPCSGHLTNTRTSPTG